MRGYFGIGIHKPKFKENLGTLWRAANVFGADFIFIIDGKYEVDGKDTMKSHKHIPLYNYKNYEDFIEHIPMDCEVVCIENSPNALNLKDFKHPERVIYLLGSEGSGLPEEIYSKHPSIIIETLKTESINVSTAGSIVLYDRFVKNTF